MKYNFLSQVKIPPGLNAKLTTEIITAVFKELKIKKDYDLGVTIVGPQRMKKLNVLYRRKNKVTDVLSFSQQEGSKIILPEDSRVYLGDIVLCFSQLKKQSKIFNHSLKYEFCLLVVHGLLHLLGYDDRTQKEYDAMAKIQDKILSKIL